MRVLLVLVLECLLAHAAARSVPPPGVPIAGADRLDLENQLGDIEETVEDNLEGNALLPDVLIFTEAVRYALQYDEFFKPDDVRKARELLRMARARVESLMEGQAPWTTATGLVVRGYVSKIDGSVQPYGLVIPPGFAPSHRSRLDAWFHGRSETLSEVSFLWDRTHNPGEFTPGDAIMLHLYGRYCNANKFAGEVDLFEALDDVKRHYPIDENRILVRGFSMGGAATWHIAAHHAGLWAAAAPGAGFAESPEYLGVYKPGGLRPTWWEEKLYHLYDATDYALNLSNTAVVAYSGEIDKQKQAADIMARAMGEENMRLTHLIGPGMAHRYHPDSKVQISRMLESIAVHGRDPSPRAVRFTTWTLRYNRMRWIVVDGLERHWERARVEAAITGDHSVSLRTNNVTAITFDMAPGECTLDPTRKTEVSIDGNSLTVDGPMSDRSWTVHFARRAGKWSVSDRAGIGGLAKLHGLQGPIDDAFMDSFVFVVPTGKPAMPGIAGWVRSEQDRAIREWRRQFRGEPRVKTDAEVTVADIASSNLVLWGDPASNRLLARLLDRLPIRWNASELIVGGERFDPASHAPVLIYPNPLNASRYVVVNSGFTFREADYLTNARQVPRLPDYAVVDTSVPPSDLWPGRIALAGFFDERWAIPANQQRTAK